MFLLLYFLHNDITKYNIGRKIFVLDYSKRATLAIV